MHTAPRVIDGKSEGPDLYRLVYYRYLVPAKGLPWLPDVVVGRVAYPYPVKGSGVVVVVVVGVVRKLRDYPLVYVMPRPLYLRCSP